MEFANNKLNIETALRTIDAYVNAPWPANRNSAIAALDAIRGSTEAIALIVANAAQKAPTPSGSATSFLPPIGAAKPVVQQEIILTPSRQPQPLANPFVQQPILQQPILQQPIVQQPILQQPILQQQQQQQPFFNQFTQQQQPIYFGKPVTPKKMQVVITEQGIPEWVPVIPRKQTPTPKHPTISINAIGTLNFPEGFAVRSVRFVVERVSDNKLNIRFENPVAPRYHAKYNVSMLPTTYETIVWRRPGRWIPDDATADSFKGYSITI